MVDDGHGYGPAASPWLWDALVRPAEAGDLEPLPAGCAIIPQLLARCPDHRSLHIKPETC